MLSLPAECYQMPELKATGWKLPVKLGQLAGYSP